ncbi:MAG: 3,4-dihydroxy-2-butanone-4-phosphate synthase [Celeribacter sp.]|jgi:3,4-dihydroxy 2-butanone 4-phosphate synthase/GTP cyclohydrolase II
MNKMTFTSMKAAVSPMASVEEILDEARMGRMFILIDHEDRENEGDLIIPASHATPEAINFMATYGRGLICLSLTEARVATLGLKPQPARGGSSFDTAFTESIEAAEGISTGISAFDRARTIRVASDPACGPQDIATPGHVFPLRARDGGVLVRAGHTEASVDICRLAGLEEAAVICEVLRNDGTMARLPDLMEFAAEHNLRIGSISDLIAWRQRNDGLIREIDQSTVSSAWGGEWSLRVFEDSILGAHHLVLTKGDLTEPGPTTVRIHALDPLADVLGVGFVAQGGPVSAAMQRIATEGRGVVVLLRETEMALPVPGAHGQRELRDYGLGAQILAALELTDLTVLGQSEPPRMIGLDAYGLRIVATERLDS